MNRTILTPYKVDMLQRMKKSILKKSLLKVRTSFMVEQGMTLIELLVAVAVLAIILAIAAPSFVTIINNNRATGVTNDLIASFQLARTEAIKRNGIVSVQSTADNINWGSGHRIFVDTNGNGKFNAGELLLRTVDAPRPAVTLTSTATDISYEGSGEAAAATTFTININAANCESGVSHKVRTVRLVKSGSTTLVIGREMCP